MCNCKYNNPDLNNLIEATLLRNKCNELHAGLTRGTDMTDGKCDVTGM